MLDLDFARMVRSRFLTNAEDAVLFGIALPRDLVDFFDEEVRPETGTGEPGVLTMLRRGAPLAPGGVALGFDVLGRGWDMFHSYICNGLEDEFDAALGIRPNRHGFFDRIEDARMCADHASLDTSGAEPALWLPWLTVAYDGFITKDPASG